MKNTRQRAKGRGISWRCKNNWCNLTSYRRMKVGYTDQSDECFFLILVQPLARLACVNSTLGWTSNSFLFHHDSQTISPQPLHYTYFLNSPHYKDHCFYLSHIIFGFLLFSQLHIMKEPNITYIIISSNLFDYL